MKVLVDTAIWSLAVRRRKPSEDHRITELATLIEDGRVAMIGPIRQEVLSGIKERAQFDRLRKYLRAFPDIDLAPEDFEEAAALYNRCRTKGIQGSNTDFLICAVATRLDLAIFTSDTDFLHFSRVLPITLHRAEQS